MRDIPFYFCMKLNPSLRFFGNRSAVTWTFTLVGLEVALVLLMIFLYHRRNRRARQCQIRKRDMRISQPRMRENPFADDPFAYSNPRDSATTAESRQRWENSSSLNTTDEQAMGYVENTSSAHGFNIQRNDVGENILYETKNPHLAGINSRVVVNYRNPNTDDPFSDRHVCQPKPGPASRGQGHTTIDHLVAVTPSRAYLPFPNWQRVSETPSSPSIYPASLSAEGSDEPDQLPAPTTIAFSKTPGVPNQSYNWGARAKKLSSHRVPVNPEVYVTQPSSDDSQSSPTVAQQEPPSDEQRRSVPPPIPPRSPLRRAMSARTILNVGFPTLHCPSTT